ncbi:hypothetical protein ATY41_04870 [Leifsonia xyli subsp. xyli]|uniref:Secreted protein n=1 Tax=Leifsonia xyli subsp. xyli TaxID=59736 RepID=A0A1E2SIT0_LEIXY|nr:hypothetical protein [Leifsonia xyli]ODA89610.1 hypothetical protein ATY41_04870 [Leifsonia xyli subsp. xyli]
MKMTKLTRALAAATAAGALLAGCTVQGAKDGGGMTEDEALELPLERQYILAGERYVAVNERLADLQRELFADEWEDGGVSSEVAPGSGFSRGNDLIGDNRDNSYDYSVSRHHAVDGDIESLLREIARSWEAKGWEVSSERVLTARRVTTTDPDGYWFEAMAPGSDLSLTALSPVYWGAYDSLLTAIAARREAEREAGAPGTSIDHDESNKSRFLPGVYLPFPAWNALSP